MLAAATRDCCPRQQRQLLRARHPHRCSDVTSSTDPLMTTHGFTNYGFYLQTCASTTVLAS